MCFSAKNVPFYGKQVTGAGKLEGPKVQSQTNAKMREIGGGGRSQRPSVTWLNALPLAPASAIRADVVEMVKIQLIKFID